MAFVPAGIFTMGDNTDTNLYGDAASTNVTVSAFYMDVNLVSYSQWLSVYSYALSHGYGFLWIGSGKAADHPVVEVGWSDCVKWCNARSQQEGLTPVYYTDAGLTQVYTNFAESNPVMVDPDTVYPDWAANGYRLPTEAEWEKAARGGLSGQRFPWGNTISENQANYDGYTNGYDYDFGPNGYNATFGVGPYPYTSPVGYFAANGYGLYDMAGNVNQWCWDWYDSPYTGGADPRGPVSSPYDSRVLRGGNWFNFAVFARCASRFNSNPNQTYSIFGFRCVRKF
jgi:formylglycine-generating enzyme required for sulfatase activity